MSGRTVCERFGEWVRRNAFALTLLALIGLYLLVLAALVGSGVDDGTVGLFTSAMTPVAVVFLGYVIDRRRSRIERQHKERIEFTVDANFFSPTEGFVPAEFLTYVHNKSNVKHESADISLLVRGLDRGETPSRWEGGPHKRDLQFPREIVDENIIPEEMRPIFVEPDVKQPLTYVTYIPETVQYVLVRAKFNYMDRADDDRFQPHSVERLFEVPPAGER